MSDDGSTSIFVGPEPLKGWENNLLKSIPGHTWFPWFHFYGPKKAYFDQNWKLPQIDEVDDATDGEKKPAK